MPQEEPGSPVRDVVFEAERVVLVLQDGRCLAAPLGWVGAVAGLEPEQRTRWVATADGRGVNWPDAVPAKPDGVLNVWMLEQDALFAQSLQDLAAVGGQTDSLAPRSRSLLALWRLTADGYNGGLLQFVGNWGFAEAGHARDALVTIGAEQTRGVLDEFLEVVQPIAASDEVTTIDDVYRRIQELGLSDRVDELDESFWEAAEELITRVPRAFGPAPSVR